MSIMDQNDSAYEEDLLNNPYNLKNWLYYLEYKSDADACVRYSIFDRALGHLPRSYKLWHMYLSARVHECQGYCIDDGKYTEVNVQFERALIHMSQMPVIWNMYLSFLLPQFKLTFTRRKFDHALRALPITQHEKWVWPLYLDFAESCGVGETSAKIWRRYVTVFSNECIRHIDALLAAEAYNDVAVQYAKILEDEVLISNMQKSRYDIWSEMCVFLVRNWNHITSIDIEAVIRSGLQQYPHETARLWTSLADLHIRKGLYARATDVYEEALRSVSTVRDASVIFEAYVKFQYQLIDKNTGELIELETQVQDQLDTNGDITKSTMLSRKVEELSMDVEIAMETMQNVMDRKAWVVNDVILRQNPNIVGEWMKRVELYGDDVERVIRTYAEAIEQIDVTKAQGRFDWLWLNFAKLYASYGQMEDARGVLDKAVTVDFKRDALGQLWCRYAELELMTGNADAAQRVLTRATSSEGRAAAENPKVWGMLADVTEALRGAEAACSVYDTALQKKVSTPQLVLSHVQLLEQRQEFTEMFRVQERAVSVFPYPSAATLWLVYCHKFVTFYAGRKVERARDLFEHALAKAPAAQIRNLFLLYARYEEKYASPRNMMKILQNACNTVPMQDKLDMYLLYLAKGSEYFGAVRVRPVYDEALKAVPENQVATIALRYAALERKLGDFDRARAIYVYASQLTNPEGNPHFWAVYQKFETAHGNEDTFKDMMKLKRTMTEKFQELSSV